MHVRCDLTHASDSVRFVIEVIDFRGTISINSHLRIKASGVGVFEAGLIPVVKLQQFLNI